ncbi:BA75_01530T0 [Komagataella pastoris]|uniref:BA75_01530T0 n=1 Tax=Komagataella pastoris TaxID=4922 RepID=A0A1B2J6S2_PICPA|nr:BA75_01530T0 [Komagataella pastoris]
MLKLYQYQNFLRGKSFLWAITLCALQGFLLLGYDQGVMSCLISDPTFNKFFKYPDEDLQGDITGTYDLGCVAGSIFCYFFGEQLGRRKALMLGGTIMVIGTVFLGAANGVGIFIAGRVITGIGNGINSSTVPTLQAECSPANIRGALLTLQGTVTILGLVIAYWAGFGTSFVESNFQWRFPVSFQAFFAVCLVIQAIGLPDTPRWLVAHGRLDEARNVIACLLDKPEDDPEVESQLFDIKTTVDEEFAGGPFKFKEFLQMGKTQNFRRLCITIGVNIMQQFTGSNMINYYAPTVYQKTMGFDNQMSMILGGCTSITYLVGSVLPVFLVDRFGRRTLLMASASGLCFCFMMVSILLSTEIQAAAYAAVAFIFIFQIFLAVGFLPVPWFLGSELNITRLRARACSIASGWNWMCVYAIVKITPIAMKNLGWKTFIIFTVLNAMWVPIVYCFFPETNGLELEDIDLIFARGGFTGGVFGTRGKTVQKHAHLNQQLKMGDEKDTGDIEYVEDASRA